MKTKKDIYEIGKALGLDKHDVDNILSADSQTSTNAGASADVYKAGTRYGTVSSADLYKAGTRYGTISINNF